MYLDYNTVYTLAESLARRQLQEYFANKHCVFLLQESASLKKAADMRPMLHGLNTAVSVCNKGGKSDLCHSFQSTHATLKRTHDGYVNDAEFFAQQADLISSLI